MSDRKPLSFHVPAPAVRPGGTPDFSDVKISLAGEVRRPEVDVAPEQIRDLAYAIIRVLDRDSEAVGPWAGLLDDEALLKDQKVPVASTRPVSSVVQTVSQ